MPGAKLGPQKGNRKTVFICDACSDEEYDDGEEGEEAYEPNDADVVQLLATGTDIQEEPVEDPAYEALSVQNAKKQLLHLLHCLHHSSL